MYHSWQYSMWKKTPLRQFCDILGILRDICYSSYYATFAALILWKLAVRMYTLGLCSAYMLYCQCSYWVTSKFKCHGDFLLSPVFMIVCLWVFPLLIWVTALLVLISALLKKLIYFKIFLCCLSTKVLREIHRIKIISLPKPIQSIKTVTRSTFFQLHLARKLPPPLFKLCQPVYNWFEGFCWLKLCSRLWVSVRKIDHKDNAWNSTCVAKLVVLELTVRLLL